MLMVLAALAFRPAVPIERLWVALALTAAGIIMLGIGLWLRTAHPVLPVPTTLPFGEGRIRWGIVAVGFGVLLALSELNGNLLQSPDVMMVSIHVQFLLLVIGVTLVTWGFSGLAWPRLPRIRRTEALVILLLTALAVALRLWNLGDGVRYPVHEGFFAYTNTVIRSDPSYRLIIPFDPNIPAPLFHNYVQLIGVKIFGQTWFGFRAASAFVAALTIPAQYLLARSLIDRKTAIIAALLLAVFPPHLHLSRLNLVNMFDRFSAR